MACEGCDIDSVVLALSKALGTGTIHVTLCQQFGAVLTPITADNFNCLEGPNSLENAPLNRVIVWMGMHSHLTFCENTAPICGFREPYLNSDLYIEVPAPPNPIFLTLKGSLTLASGCIAHFNYCPIPTHDYLTFTGVSSVHTSILFTCGDEECFTAMSATDLPLITSYRTREIVCPTIESLACKSPCLFCMTVFAQDLIDAGFVLLPPDGPIPPAIAGTDTRWQLYVQMDTCTPFPMPIVGWYKDLPLADPPPALPECFVAPINPVVAAQCPNFPFPGTELNPCLFGGSATYVITDQVITLGDDFEWFIHVDYGFNNLPFPTPPSIDCILGPYPGKTSALISAAFGVPGDGSPPDPRPWFTPVNC